MRKDSGLQKVFMRWHNKNKHGGNFGFNLIAKNYALITINYELCGYYNEKGEITSLGIGKQYQNNIQIKGELTYKRIIKLLMLAGSKDHKDIDLKLSELK